MHLKHPKTSAFSITRGFILLVLAGACLALPQTPASHFEKISKRSAEPAAEVEADAARCHQKLFGSLKSCNHHCKGRGHCGQLSLTTWKCICPHTASDISTTEDLSKRAAEPVAETESDDARCKPTGDYPTKNLCNAHCHGAGKCLIDDIPLPGTWYKCHCPRAASDSEGAENLENRFAKPISEIADVEDISLEAEDLSKRIAEPLAEAESTEITGIDADAARCYPSGGWSTKAQCKHVCKGREHCARGKDPFGLWSVCALKGCRSRKGHDEVWL